MQQLACQHILFQFCHTYYPQGPGGLALGKREGVGEDERKEGWGWKAEEESLEEGEEAVATFASRPSV